MKKILIIVLATMFFAASCGGSDKITCKTVSEWDKSYPENEGGYEEEEEESIFCNTTGEEVTYCIRGDYNDEVVDVYSIKVGEKEFKCGSGNAQDCYVKMAIYCGEFDGEYEDGLYCEELSQKSSENRQVKNLNPKEMWTGKKFYARQLVIRITNYELRNCFGIFPELSRP